MASKKVCKIRGRYYLYERDSYWDPTLKKARQRNSRYLGPCDENGTLLATPNPRIDEVHSSMPVGPMAMLYASAQDLSLVSHMQSTLDIEREKASHLLCMVMNQVLGHRSIRQLGQWVLQGPLMQWEKLDAESVTDKNFRAALSSLCWRAADGSIMDHGLDLQRRMTTVWRGNTRESAEYYYDVTKQVYFGNCHYAQAGYFPGGTRKNVIGFGMVISRTNHLPVLCRAIPGSYNDKVSVQDTVNNLRAWGFEHLTFIMDRGMVSRDIVEYLANSGYYQIGIVPETNREAWDYIGKWPANEIEQPSFVVDRRSGQTVYARSWTAPLFGRKDVRIALIVDPERKVAEQMNRDTLLHDLQTVTDKNRLREIRAELGPLAVPARGRRGFAVDDNRVVEDRMGDGRFLMFSTNDNLSAETMLEVYFQRDVVEKAFRTMKGEIALGPVRYRRREHIDAHTTLVYLGYLLWRWTERRLREKYPAMTLNEAIALVENVSLVRFRSGKIDRDWVTKLTTEQRNILSTVDALKHLPVA
jgi:hypothetical protein